MSAGPRKRPDPRRRTTLAALFGALVLAALSYAALTAGNGIPLKSYYYLNADFHNAAELDPYSDVRIAGRLVGQVLSSSFSDGNATVRLQLDPSIGELRAATTARIRLRGLLGAKYVELTPGRGGPALRSGATIPASHTSTAVGVFDVLAAFDAKRQADLRAMLGGLGQGFLGRGAQLNDALVRSPALASNVAAVANAVDARAGAAQRFVPGAQSLAAAFDPVRGELASGWGPEARALQPFTDERASLQATLAEGPTALSQLQQGLARTDPLLAETASLSRELIAFTGPAPAAFTAATALLRQAPAPLAKARNLAGALGGAVPPVLRLLVATWPLAAPIAKALRNETAPLIQLGRYGCDVSGWARDWSAGYALGSPPQTPSGPMGIVRAGLVFNSSAGHGNTPGSLHSRYYEPPCTAIYDRAP
jgi:virulence factor Mce-like protein